MRAPGVIMTPVGHDAAGLLAAQGVAVVEVDRRVARVPCDAVVLDNEGGARDATAHLLALGHRRIGLLMAKTNWSSDAGRLAGYLSAHEDAHVPVDEKLIVEIEFQAADAGARIATLLAEAAPTALFAGNNVLAELAWHAIRKRGLSIPGDISVVAFDDMAWMAMVQPGITAVAQPTFAMGCRAALLLLRRLEAPLSEQTVEVLEPTLVLRGSTAEPVAIS
jgi:LacI family transcriptional regulator